MNHVEPLFQDLKGDEQCKRRYLPDETVKDWEH